MSTRSHSPLLVYLVRSPDEMRLMRSIWNPSYVHEPNLSGQRCSSNGKKVTSMRHELFVIAGTTHNTIMSADLTTQVAFTSRIISEHPLGIYILHTVNDSRTPWLSSLGMTHTFHNYRMSWVKEISHIVPTLTQPGWKVGVRDDSQHPQLLDVLIKEDPTLLISPLSRCRITVRDNPQHITVRSNDRSCLREHLCRWFCLVHATRTESYRQCRHCWFVIIINVFVSLFS